jgi:uncharacterized protein YndB with AHSA1/START domain
MRRPSFVYVLYIATTPEKLWSALTDGTLTREYWGGRQVESDWKPGAPVLWRKQNGQHDAGRARVVEATPPQTLVLDWTSQPEAGAPVPPATRVTFSIQPAGPKNVKLTVIHDEYEPRSVVEESARQGWSAILSSLKTYLETGEALDISKRFAAEGH